MSNRTVARRYAQSLLEEAIVAANVDEIDADIKTLSNAIAESRDFAVFLQSPILSRDKKLSIIDALFSKRVQPLTFRFVRLLVANDREGMLPDVIEAYRELRDEQEGVVEADATVAMPISETDKESLKRAVARMTGKKIRLRVHHDSDLIGGLVVRVGDTVYDGSVRHQLEMLRGQLQPGRPHTNGTDRGARPLSI